MWPDFSDMSDEQLAMIAGLTESRVMKLSKDDLRLHEQQQMWTDELHQEVVEYWQTLNRFWKDKKLPPCTCLDHDGGFLGKRSKKGKIYNDYFYEETPCSLDWYNKVKAEGLL